MTNKECFWLCEQCKAHGSVEVESHTDLMTGLYAVQDAHDKVSPQCTFDVWKVKVSFTDPTHVQLASQRGK